MSFLQPWMLLALPLAALPVVIHLVHQRRFQTVPWGAMLFLLSARALSRGNERLRHWLILALRTLAVAAVILAAGRPLSRGWLALAGGARPDAALVILDRSPSMQQRGTAAAATKLDTARRQVADALATLAPDRCLLIDGPDAAVEVGPPAGLGELPAAGPRATATDVPRLLAEAERQIRDRGYGSAEVWICSDQRRNDWAVDAPAWPAVREAFARLPQPVRLQLVSFPGEDADNLAVRVRGVRVEPRGGERTLVLTVTLARTGDGPSRTVPVVLEIGGASSTIEVELVGREAVVQGHTIALAGGGPTRGFGRVSIPADANAADNEFYFVYDEPPPRRTVVVAEDPAARRVLALAAGIPPEKPLPAAVDALDPAGFAAAALDETALVLWQAPLPSGGDAEQLAAFVARGGQVIFLPPETPSDTAFAGLAWTTWTDHPREVAAESWRTDQGLLANTASGEPLPVGQVAIRRSCGLAGDQVALASLPGGRPLLVRAGGAAGVSFLATGPTARDSGLAGEGVVLYALVQRAIDRGLESLGRARQLDAGPAAAALLAESGAEWTRRAGPPGVRSTEAGLHAGVYATDDRLVAVNRPAAEDAAPIVSDARIDELFAGLSFARATGAAGRGESLVQEIWRGCLVAVLVALVAEGLLCLPRAAGRPAGPVAAAAGRGERAA